MKTLPDFEKFIRERYKGRILNGRYSESIKQRVRECIESLHGVDNTAIPVVVYLAAWKEDDKTIWYEYVNEYFINLIGCSFSEIDGVFRNSVVDHRVYKYKNKEDDIEKKIISRRELSVSRKKLRQEGERKGTIEAVYKIFREEGRAIWLKDQARIELHKNDGIYLSIGCMTDISKEMEEAEEMEREILRLKKA